MKEIIQECVKQNIYVFPCKKSDDKFIDKTPYTIKGFKDATCDAHTIKRFWMEDYYIGLATGKMSGIVVIDFDINKKIPGTDEIDTRTVEDLKEEVNQNYGELPETFEVETKSGGRHCYYLYPENVERIPPRSRFLDKFLPVDIRADDSYVITIDDKDYVVYDDVEELGITNLKSRCAKLPEWIVSYTKEKESQTVQQEIAQVLPETEVRELRSALSYVSSDDRDTWIRMGMALKTTNSPTGFGIWNEWSKTSDKYNPNDMEKRWRGLKPSGDLTIASVFHEAKRYGWQSSYKEEVPIVINQDEGAGNLAFLTSNVSCSEHERIAKRKEEIKKKPFPVELLKAPGLVGEIADYINRSAIYEQPVFSLSSALCCIGTLAGRKYKSQTDLRTNLYCLNVGLSGAGKNFPPQAIRKLLHLAGCGQIASVDNIASDSAIETELQRANLQAQLFTIDEVGRFLKTTNSGTSYLYNIVSVLLRLYSAANSVYYCKSYADSERKKQIDQPHLCLIGSTVPDNLYKGLSYESATDGFLSRMLIFESDDPLPEEKDFDDINEEVPESIIEQIKKLNEKSINSVPEGNLDQISHPRPQTVLMESDAKEILKVYRQNVREKRLELQSQCKIDAMYNRAVESAIKIGMIVAIGKNINNPLITPDDIMYGIELSQYLSEHMEYVVDKHMAKNDYEHEAKNIFNIICASGSASLEQVAKETQHLPTYQRDNLLQGLLESEQIYEQIRVTNNEQKRFFCIK